MVKKIVLSIAMLSSLLNADMFEKGKSNVGVSLGAGSSYNGTYTLVGVNANYFALDNLAVGVMYRGWFGVDPMRNELSLSTNYFIPVSEKFHPYLGAFVRETFVEGFDAYESYGARGGLAITTSKNSFVSFGYVYEEYSNCILDNECSSSYPEIIFGLSF